MNAYEEQKADVLTLARQSRSYRGRKMAEVHTKDDGATMMASGATFFFEDHDDQKIDFRGALMRHGFSDDAKRGCFYNAPYHWRVDRDGVSVEYVEGDVYVRCEHKAIVGSESGHACHTCGTALREMLEDCTACLGTGRMTIIEQVYPGEPHTAPLGEVKCPACEGGKVPTYEPIKA